MIAHIKAVQQGYQLGARTFLIKPINEEDVLQMLNTLKGVSVIQNKEGYIISLDSEPQPTERASNPSAESLQRARF